MKGEGKVGDECEDLAALPTQKRHRESGAGSRAQRLLPGASCPPELGGQVRSFHSF